MQNEGCAECIAAMERVKGELLARIACANCQHCQKAQDDVAQRQRELAGVWLLGVRCPQCGKRCWTKHGLAIHRCRPECWADN